KEERISHFRPFQDFSRVSVLNVFLVIITLIYIKPLNLIRSFKKKNILEFLKDNLLNPDETNQRKVFSIMFGVFMGIFPVWGYQLIIGIALTHFLKLNKVIFILAAHISIPPMIPIIIFVSHRLGGIVLSVPQKSIAFNSDISLATIKEEMFQYLVGAVALSIAASLIAGIIAFISLKLFQTRKGQLQQ
ncbi:MAG TPA: DUF2062 domain-containing protein, partial [Cytophagaceae bacterium]